LPTGDPQAEQKFGSGDWAASAEAVDEAEIDCSIEAAQKVARLDEALIKGLVKKALLSGIVPEHEWGSIRREVLPNYTLPRSLAA
jgi:hypothetical protein